MQPDATPTVVVVTFPADTSLDTPSLRALLESTGPRYADMPGLTRKYFLNGDGIAGGVYEWVDRGHADAFHDAAWRAALRARAGADPVVQVFDAPAIADGVAGRLDIFLPD